jgi:hypothetical protein
MKEKPTTINIVTPVSIPRQRVASLLVGAMEGGSNYWLSPCEVEEIAPAAPVMILDADDDFKPRIWPMYDYPLTEGGEVRFTFEGPKNAPMTCALNLSTIEKGLQVMAEKYPRHFRNFIDCRDDADTSDVFVQCCFFGELIYG